MTGWIILLYMTGLGLRRFQEWQKRTKLNQLINSRRKITCESRIKQKSEDQDIQEPHLIQLNNQNYNPEVTKTWHNYVLPIIVLLTLLIPQIYARTNFIFIAELLEFRIHIICTELIYLISIYMNNHRLRNFVRTTLE